MTMAHKLFTGTWLSILLIAGGIGFGTLVGFGIERMFGWRPYYSVEVISLHVEDGDLHVIANFVKSECVIQRLNVIGYVGEAAVFLDYRDLDGLEFDHDRSQGFHTLRLAIDLEERNYDWIELRTRHDCQGELVDRVFARLDNLPSIRETLNGNLDGLR